jgi:putative hemolysin
VLAGAEIAILAVRKTRLHQLLEEGRKSARAVLHLREHPERFLATVQIGITVVGACAAAFSGRTVAVRLANALNAVGVDDYAEEISFALVIAGISFLSLVLGELVPKSLALRRTEAFSLLIARVLVLLAKLAKPAVWVLTFSSNLVLRAFRDTTSFSESRLSPDELQQLVEEAASTGTLTPAAGEIASRAIDLAQLRVKDVMVPRSRVVAIALDSTTEQLRNLLKSNLHTRYPVFERSIDNVVGYVTARELYEALVQGDGVDVRALMRPALFVPDSTSVVQALRRFQEARQRLSLVVDETGGVVGVVTITDVAEELIGEMLDEYEAPDQFVRLISEGVFAVRGEAPIHEVERELSVTLGEDDTRSATIAGLIIEQLGHIPKKGEHVALSPEIEAEITDATERRVRALVLRRTLAAAEV